MIYLKEANYDDFAKEYEYISNLLEEENGFTNEYYGCTYQEFEIILDRLINHSKGVDLKPGHVPCTHFFLWNNDNIIGLFRIRHSLNSFLADGPGHISYGIKKECRGNGYGTEGLRLAVKIAKELISEDEIYECR